MREEKIELTNIWDTDEVRVEVNGYGFVMLSQGRWEVMFSTSELIALAKHVLTLDLPQPKSDD